MTPGDDGAGRPSGLSRRQLLTGIGGVGAVGMASGLGTGAYLADRETFSNNTLGAGTVELLVNGTATDGTINVNVSGIDRGNSDRERFEIGAQTNPVRVWLATECVPSDALSRALEVDLRADGASLTGGYRPLADVRADLLTGERIDDGCLDPEDEDTIMVVVHWRLPADAPDAAANSSTSLTFLLYAEQCRHVDEPNAVGPASLDEATAAASNPFADRVCDEAEDCPECVKFGKANFGGSTVPGDVLPLEMLLGGAGEHEVEITEVETKDDGEVVGVAFRLQDADGNPGPDMCSVAVKGGPDRGVELADIDPASPETGKIVFAPLKPGNDKRYGVSNVTISVCARDSEAAQDDGPLSDGDSNGDGTDGGSSSGGKNGNKGKNGNSGRNASDGGSGGEAEEKPGKAGRESRTADGDGDRGESAGSGDTEAN